MHKRLGRFGCRGVDVAVGPEIRAELSHRGGEPAQIVGVEASHQVEVLGQARRTV